MAKKCKVGIVFALTSLLDATLPTPMERGLPLHAVGALTACSDPQYLTLFGANMLPLFGEGSFGLLHHNPEDEVEEKSAADKEEEQQKHQSYGDDVDVEIAGDAVAHAGNHLAGAFAETFLVVVWHGDVRLKVNG